MKYWDREVTLVDKYDIVVGIWKYLQLCSVKDILGLPALKRGEKIERINFDCIEQAWLMGFLLKRGSRSPDLTCSEWGEVEIPRAKKRIAENLHKIKHWKIIHGEYTTVLNQSATWFIDPPYKEAGVTYRHGSRHIDFTALGEYCRDREGQVIVCESLKASWLPFVPLKRMNGIKYSSTDVMYSNLSTNYDYQQMTLQL